MKILSILFAYIVGPMMSCRVKRMLFSSSLYSHLKHIDPSKLSDEELTSIVDEIDRRMILNTVDPRTPKLGIIYHDIIWRDMGDTALSSASKVIEKTPSWLRYDVKTMSCDIRRILTAQAA